MGLCLEIMNAAPAILPSVETEAAWSAAADRVERYLRAHGLASPAQIARLTADIIAIARTRTRPDAHPMTLAMETLDESLRAWFAQLLPAGEAGDATLLARGRVALALGEVPARWPNYFMAGGRAVPVELVRAMREADLGRAPEIKFSNMAPRLIAQPSAVLGRLRWQWSYRWPFLRIVTSVMVVLSLLGATLSAGQ
jgi:hypothetical protein